MFNDRQIVKPQQSGTQTSINTVNDCFAELLVPTRKAELVFIHDGFSGWANGGRSLDEHAASNYHKEATLKQSDSTPKVDAMLDRNIAEKRKANKKHMCEVVKAHIFLARQNIAIRAKC